MPTFIFVPRCMECREPAAVVDEGKYFCGSCFLERTRKVHHEKAEAEKQQKRAS
ncbi:MAG TPA: hypothetical protein VJ901_03975 [Thermoanaerobaculia bacterium]|nr:hypothetical protein [Thermoanaerobaculia bacterium]